jgi:hypothetical protein
MNLFKYLFSLQWEAKILAFQRIRQAKARRRKENYSKPIKPGAGWPGARGTGKLICDPFEPIQPRGQK